MPIPEQVRQAIADYNEVIAEKRFRKLDLSVQRLDHQGPRKRPEFLISDTSGPVLVAEVKSIFSGGYLRDRSAHASTLDPAFPGKGATTLGIDFHEEVLEEAVQKYDCLVKDHPEYAGLPFTVVL